MQKTALVILAAYAAIVSTLLMLGVIGERGPAPAADSGDDDVGVALRDAVTRARHEAQKVYQANVLKQEARLQRYDSMIREYAEQLGDLDGWIEELSKRNAGGMDKIVQDLEGLRPLAARMKAQAEELEALGKRVKEVEDRPAVVREIIKSGGPVQPTEPKKPDAPTLPVKREEDPAKVQEKIAGAMANLQSKKLMELWAAIEVMRKYKVKSAAPQLIEILSGSKEKFARQAAATALGELQWADAMLPLADALKDDQGVAQMAAKAINNIAKVAGRTFDISHSARPKERTRLRNEVLAWWRGNEEVVRTQLGQPKS